MPRKLIRVAHSPDSDDAFMFHALANGKLETGEFEFQHILRDIESLNRWAMEGRYEVTAVSIHAYAFVAGRYRLLPHGGSVGDRYGPRLVARRPFSRSELGQATIAVPGTLTTAFLALNFFLPQPKYKVVPFDQILEAVQDGRADAGLLIHEGQLTFAARGFQLVADLGEWWHEETGLPLPLGGNVIRKDLAPDVIAEVSRLLLKSIEYALSHRAEALEYARQFARDLPQDLADRFVGMYVNQATLDYGPVGRKAIQVLLDRGYEAGLIPRQVQAEFV